jgi:hypothetical protein
MGSFKYEKEITLIGLALTIISTIMVMRLTIDQQRLTTLRLESECLENEKEKNKKAQS